MFWDVKPYRQTRKDTVLEEGIVSLDGTTGVYKVGDGVTPWAELVEFRPFHTEGETSSDFYSFAGGLKTDVSLFSEQDLYARQGAASEVKVGNTGPTGQSGISFQNGEFNLYRSDPGVMTAAGVINLEDGALAFDGYATGYLAPSTILPTGFHGLQLTSGMASIDLQDDGNYATVGLNFGDDGLEQAGFTRLGSFVTNDFSAREGAPEKVGIGAVGPGGASGIAFQDGEVNLYRSAPSTLSTQNQFHFVNDTWIGYGGPAGDNYFRGTNYVEGNTLFRPASTGGTGKFVIDVGSGTLFWGDNTNPTDTNLYRASANTLKTDDDFKIAFGKSLLLADTADADGGKLFVNSNNELVLGQYNTKGIVLSASPGILRVGGVGGTDDKIEFGSAFDTNLYRSGADSLATDDEFIARNGQPYQVRLGYVGGAAGIYFGSAGDTNLYRSAASVLKTDGWLYAAGEVIGRVGADGQVQIGDVGGGIAGIQFGNPLDTSFFRSATNELKTWGSIVAGGSLAAASGAGVNQVEIGTYGPGGQGALAFGAPVDTNLYRRASNVLHTDGYFEASESIIALQGSGGQINIGPGGLAKILFGIAGDTDLYRASAYRLQTSNQLESLGLVWGHYGAEAAIVGKIGPSSESGIAFQNFETTLYRLAANSLKTNGSLNVAKDATSYWGQTSNAWGADGTVPSSSLVVTNPHNGAYDAAFVLRQATSTGVQKTTAVIDVTGTSSWTDGLPNTQKSDLVFITRDDADTLQERARITSDGYLSVNRFVLSGWQTRANANAAAQTAIGDVGPSAEAGVLFGLAGDTNLYRLSATNLKTDGGLLAGGWVYGSHSLSEQVAIGNVGPSSQSGISFQSGEVSIYRSAALALNTGGHFLAGGDLYARLGGAGEIAIGTQGPSSESGIKFGSAGDTNLYRAAANQLATDDTFTSQGEIIAQLLSGSRVELGDVGGGQAGLLFGSTTDTNLYRSAAAILQTDGILCAGGIIVANRNDTPDTRLGAVGPSAQSGVKFGIAGDTNLYRKSAALLATDHEFESTTAGNGIYLKSSGGNRFKVTVDDTGHLVTAAA